MPIDDILKQAATARALTKATQATKATPEYGGAMDAGLAVGRRLRGLGLTMFAPQFVDAARNSSLAQARQMTGGSSVNPTASAILNMRLGKLPSQGQASALDDANKPDQGAGFDSLPFDIHQFKIAVKSQRKGQTRPLVPTVDEEGHYTLGMAAMRVAKTLGDRGLYRKLLNPASPEFKRLDKATLSVPARYQPSLDAQVEQSGQTGLGAQLIKEYGVQGLAGQSNLGLAADSVSRVLSPITTATGLMGDSRVAHWADGGQDDFEWWEQPARFTEDVALQVLTGGAVGAGMARAAVRGAVRATGPSLIRSAMRPVLTNAIGRTAAQVAVKAGTTSLMRQVVSHVAGAAGAQVGQIAPQIVSGAEMRRGQGEAPVEAYGRAAGDAVGGFVSSMNALAPDLTPGERITAAGQLALMAIGAYKGAKTMEQFRRRMVIRKIVPELGDKRLSPNVVKPLYLWARQVHRDAKADPAALLAAQQKVAHLLGDLPRDDFRVGQGQARGVTITPHDSLGVQGGGIIEGQINGDGSIEVRRDTPDAHVTHELDHQSEAALGLDPQSFVTRFSEGDRDQIAGHIYELALQDAQRQKLSPEEAKAYAEYYSGRRKRLSGGYDFIENGTGDSELARFAIQRAFDGEKPGRGASAAYQKLIAGMDQATLNRLRPERIGHGTAAESGLAQPVSAIMAEADQARRAAEMHFARYGAVDAGGDARPTFTGTPRPMKALPGRGESSAPEQAPDGNVGWGSGDTVRQANGSLGDQGPDRLGGVVVGTTRARHPHKDGWHPMTYRVVELDSLIPSHDAETFAPDLRYDSSLQPRDRALQDKRDQVKAVAANLDATDQVSGESPTTTEGSPIVGIDGQVEGGNGRVMAMQRARNWHPEVWAAYTDKIRAKYPEAAGMDHPVLVRVRDQVMTPEERSQFAHDTNGPVTAPTSQVENATTDARFLTPDVVDRIMDGNGRAGDILAGPSNREARDAFLRSLPDLEAARVENDPSELRRRLGNAATAYVLGDDGNALVKAMTHDDQLSGIESAIHQAAVPLMRAVARSERGAAPSFDIRPVLTQALSLIKSQRDSQLSPKAFWEQYRFDAGDFDPSAVRLAFQIAEHQNRTGEIAQTLRGFADAVAPSGGLFGEDDVPPMTVAEAVKNWPMPSGFGGDAAFRDPARYSVSFEGEDGKARLPRLEDYVADGLSRMRPQREIDAEVEAMPVHSRVSKKTGNTVYWIDAPPDSFYPSPEEAKAASAKLPRDREARRLESEYREKAKAIAPQLIAQSAAATGFDVTGFEQSQVSESRYWKLSAGDETKIKIRLSNHLQPIHERFLANDPKVTKSGVRIQLRSTLTENGTRLKEIDFYNGIVDPDALETALSMARDGKPFNEIDDKIRFDHLPNYTGDRHRFSVSFDSEGPLRRDENPRTIDNPEDPTIGERNRNRDILMRRGGMKAGAAPGVTRRTWKEAQGLADMRAAKEDVSRVLGEKGVGQGITDVEQAQAYGELRDIEALIDRYDEQVVRETRPEYQEAIRRDRDRAVEQYADLSARVMDLKSDNGRNLAAARMLASSFQGNVERAIRRATAMARRDLTDPERKGITDAAHEVTRIQDEIDAISGGQVPSGQVPGGGQPGTGQGQTPGGQPGGVTVTIPPELQQRHRAALMLLAQKIVEPTETTGWEFLKGVFRAGLLSSARAGQASLFGNAGMQIVNTISRMPSTAIDAMVAMKTGTRTVSMRGSLQGFRATYSLDSAKQAYNAIVHGASDLGAAKGDTQRKLMYKKGGWITVALSHAANKVFDLLEAADTPVRRGELTRALQEAAWLQAKNEGLRGADIETRMTELLGSDPNPEVVLAALASRVRTSSPTEAVIVDAIRQQAMMREDEALMANSSKATRAVSALSDVAPMVMPFAKIPTNASAQALEHTPAGAIYGAVRTIQALTGKGTDPQRQGAVALGKSLTGLGVFLLGYNAYQAGILSSPAGITKQERDTQQATGEQGNSIKIGNRWFALRDYPFAAMLMAGAKSAQMEKDGHPDPIGAVKYAVASTTLDIPTMQTVRSITQDVQEQQASADNPDDTGGKSTMSSTLDKLGGSIIPAIIADMITSGDPNARMPRGFADELKADTPRRSELAIQYDALGRPVTRNTGPMSQIRGLSPDQGERQRDPVAQEIRRLGVEITRATEVTNPKRIDRDRDAFDYSERVRRVGEMTRQGIGELMKDPWYAKASDEQRKEVMAKVIKKYRQAANLMIRAERAKARASE